MKLKILQIVIAGAAIGLAAGCTPKESREEYSAAKAMGRLQAIDLAKTITLDTLKAETLILDIRSREAELRRRGASKVADNYINAFFETLDSVSPGLAEELKAENEPR